LASGATFEMDQLVRRWVEGDVDRAEALAIADRFRGAEGQERFETLMDRLIAAVRMRALQSAPGAGNRWAELWERLQPLPERAAGLNLDKADVLAGALADLKRVQAQQDRIG
jgi:DNA polymerase-3 subunit delta'